MSALNQILMRRLLSCCRFLGGRAHSNAYLPILLFIKSISLRNHYLDPECNGGRVTPWLISQGNFEASTHFGEIASLLDQNLDGRLASADFLRMSVRILLSAIPFAYETLRDIVTFEFFSLHLFSVGGRHSSAVAYLLCLSERLEELHTEVQGMITYPHLATALLYDVSQCWSLYFNMCVSASALEAL